MTERRWVLGVDGGGTKTAYVITDEHGDVRGAWSGPTTDYLAIGLDALEETLADGVAAVLAEAALRADDLAFAVLGLSAYGEVGGDVSAIDAVPATVLGHDRYRCDNDVVVGWAGSLGGEDGINVVAGTGSISYGEWQGRRARAGGWGELLGDEGSGYWVGLRGLNAFTQMEDGRVPAGPLRDAVRERLGDGEVLGIVGTLSRASRTTVAAFSRCVVAAADAGDSIAGSILEDGARELGALVRANRAALGVPAGEVVTLSYSGGMFSVPRYLQMFVDEIHRADTRCEVRAPAGTPVEGAALLAVREARARGLLRSVTAA